MNVEVNVCIQTYNVGIHMHDYICMYTRLIYIAVKVPHEEGLRHGNTSRDLRLHLSQVEAIHTLTEVPLAPLDIQYSSGLGRIQQHVDIRALEL